MVREFPEFYRFSLNFFKKAPFSRFSRFTMSCTNPVGMEHLLLVGPKKTKWRKSFVIFIFIPNNPIFKSTVSFFWLGQLH